MNAVFAASYLGDRSKLDDATALECGICWHVYDPAAGDPATQIAAGTPFSALPETWRCPNCDAPKQKFMALRATAGAADEVVERLAGAYRKIAASMAGLPVYNPALVVEAVGFRTLNDDRRVGVVVTPWFMNLTVLPNEADRREWLPGVAVRLTFASGEYDFDVHAHEHLGLLATCSLFSPMNDFTDHEAARLAATAAIDALFEPDAESQSAPITRRALLGGGR